MLQLRDASAHAARLGSCYTEWANDSAVCVLLRPGMASAHAVLLGSRCASLLIDVQSSALLYCVAVLEHRLPAHLVALPLCAVAIKLTHPLRPGSHLIDCSSFSSAASGSLQLHSATRVHQPTTSGIGSHSGSSRTARRVMCRWEGSGAAVQAWPVVSLASQVSPLGSVVLSGLRGVFQWRWARVQALMELSVQRDGRVNMLGIVSRFGDCYDIRRRTTSG